MTVAGVDGCRGGWVVALAEPDDGALVDVVVLSTFADVVALLVQDVTHVAVDMPIGLPDAGSRACDVAARRLLGLRRSTVFPAPPRPILDERDYPTALARKRAIDGVGLSKQAFNLLPRIAEVDAALTPELQSRIVECHPELAFQRRHGEPLESKHTAPGRAQRQALVADLVGDRPLPRLAGTRPDDVLDALALTWTARAICVGREERLGDARRDARGLVMEIVW